MLVPGRVDGVESGGDLWAAFTFMASISCRVGVGVEVR
jgi:hypothetical protein